MNFQIDALSNLAIQTLAEPVDGTFDDQFDDTTEVATSTAIAVTGGEAVLAGAPGSYSSSGTLFSIAVNPGTLASWDTFSYQSRTPSNTSVLVHVYDRTGTTTPTLIPDSVLPGNSTGFAQGSVDISAIDPSTYQELALGATLTSSDTATTSAILNWNVSYTASQAAIGNVPLTLTGAKTIGTTASSAPVYKYKSSFSTDGSGQKQLTGLEWDAYSVVLNTSSYDIAEACNDIPYALEPGVSETLTLTLAPATTYSLRVDVVDATGAHIPNASVTLSRPAFNSTQVTSLCGQTFFNSGLTSATDYSVAVTATGYVDQTVTDVTVSASNAITVTMASS
jgi:hypothetical protein